MTSGARSAARRVLSEEACALALLERVPHAARRLELQKVAVQDRVDTDAACLLGVGEGRRDESAQQLRVNELAVLL